MHTLTVKIFIDKTKGGKLCYSGRKDSDIIADSSEKKPLKKRDEFIKISLQKYDIST